MDETGMGEEDACHHGGDWTETGHVVAGDRGLCAEPHPVCHSQRDLAPGRGGHPECPGHR